MQEPRIPAKLKLLLFASMAVLVLCLAWLTILVMAPVEPAPDVAEVDLSDPVNRLWAVPEFELINSAGDAVSSRDLRNKVWIANFIFTRCPGPCPLMTKRFSDIQEAVDSESFRLVSFTVDPSYDTPQVLADYARNWKADAGRWHFLTHPEPERMAEMARDFKVAAVRGPSSGPVPNITHGTNFLLVDGGGFVRAVYNSDDADVVDRVKAGVRKLLEAEQ